MHSLFICDVYLRTAYLIHTVAVHRCSSADRGKNSATEVRHTWQRKSKNQQRGEGRHDGT